MTELEELKLAYAESDRQKQELLIHRKEDALKIELLIAEVKEYKRNLAAELADLKDATDCMFEMLTMLRYQLTDSGWTDREGHTIELNAVFKRVCDALDESQPKEQHA